LLTAAQAAGAVAQIVGSIADVAAHIEDVMRDEAARNKEDMRQEDNEFNIRKSFLDNAVNALQVATCNQFNIVICTNQEHDDFQDLEGRILPSRLLNLEIAPNKTMNFEAYVFDTGKYLRHGKYERDHWWYWGETKKFYDPAAMHVHFDKAQSKLNPDNIKRQQDKNAADAKTAADAAATTQKLLATTTNAQAATAQEPYPSLTQRMFAFLNSPSAHTRAIQDANDESRLDGSSYGSSAEDGNGLESLDVLFWGLSLGLRKEPK